MSFEHSFDSSLGDTDNLPVGITACALHPAPKRVWDQLIWVICTIKGRSYRTINEFFIAADSPLPIEERHSAFLFFRTKETRHFESRRKEILKRGGIWYIERDGKAEEPIESGNVPANMWPVSVELDEQTDLDRRSCLIRVNGKKHDGFFGEVRCDWRAALHVTTEILHKISTVAEVQNQAAIHGGVFPEDWRYSERDQLPQELLRPSMPLEWQRRDGGTPWPVVEEFLEQVNLSPWDSEYRRRVCVIDIDFQRPKCYDLIDEAPVPPLSGCFHHLSHQAICYFLRSKCSGNIAFTNFVILDKHTTKTHIKEPTFNPADRTTFRGREWHCILGDTVDRKWDHLIMVRCAFDSCAEVIDDVNFSGGGLCEYANDAAVEGSGFFRFPMDREAYRARQDELIRDIAALRARDSRLFPKPRCEVVALPQTAPISVESQTNKRDASSSSTPPPESQQQLQPRERHERKKKKRSDCEPAWELECDDNDLPTPPPGRRHKISDLRPNGDYTYHSSPETDYTRLFSQRFALGTDDAWEEQQPRRPAALPSFNLLESCTPAGSIMTQQERRAWDDDDDDNDADDDDNDAEDEDDAILKDQVAKVDDGSGGHVDDDYYDIRFPEVTGSTQML